jgi:hypothetical protein
MVVSRALITKPTMNEIKHLLENENEYGIAKPLHMERFCMENYDARICGTTAGSESTITTTTTKMIPPKVIAASDLLEKEVVQFVQEDPKHYNYAGSDVPHQFKNVKVDPTKIHEYKHNFDEAEF